MLRFVIPLYFVAAAAAAEPLLIDACVEQSAWRFHEGREFPGAKGSLAAVRGEGLAITWDFSGGGAYVTAAHAGPFPPEATAFIATVRATTGCAVNWRISDRSGRTFQAKPTILAAGTIRPLRIDRDGPWQSAWGGVDGAQPGRDLADVSLVFTGTEKGSVGSATLQRLAAECATPVVYPVDLPPVDTDLAGWHLRGRWLPQWGNPLFEGTIERAGGADGELAITLPQLGRDWRQHSVLDEDRREVRFTLPLAGGGNPHASYRVTFAVTAGALTAQRTVELAGSRSAEATLGQPRRSADLPFGAFGTGVHFSYGRNGAFAGWKDYEGLLDQIAAAGLTWVRDGVTVRKAADGKPQVDPYDLGWLQAARARGLKPIVILWMNAEESPRDFATTAAQVATQLDGIAAVFELGNEPNNFGGWIKKFGGTWNGKEADNSTSAWVKAHLASSNAAAEAIRAVRPDATVIALGAVPPTNFRAIDLGLSTAIDGVVDHPYAGCMPAERVPYGRGLEKRDGVAVGDEVGSFIGLIRSYQEKFAKSATPRAVWITEFGWPTYIFNGTNEAEHGAGFSERAQAVYFVRRWLLGLVVGVPASCQYDFIDDYGSVSGQTEANFGMIRADRSRKPSFIATQHLTSLFNGQQPDPTARIEVVKGAIPVGIQRGVLVKDWDGAAFLADNSVQAWAFHDPKQPDVRTLAVWSAQPVSGEFSPRYAEVRIDGWQDMTSAPFAINLLTGVCYDVPYVRENGAIVLKMNIGEAPLAVRLFRR